MTPSDLSSPDFRRFLKEQNVSARMYIGYSVKKILLIDDDSELREVLSQALSQAGYEVTTGADGRQASVICRAKTPDIVITDIYMPNKDGLEALMVLHHDFPKVKVIAISGGISKQNILQVAMALGASSTLSKPFQPAELLAVVEKVANS